MTSSQRASGRRRRENVAGGRQHSHRVLVSPEEEAVLVRLAAEKDVSVARLLMEAALSGGGETPTQRKEAIAELFASRRLLATITLDVRELVERDVFDEVTLGAVTVLLERVRDVAKRLDETVDVLAEA